jgi:hypothetical protein
MYASNFFLKDVCLTSTKGGEAKTITLASFPWNERMNMERHSHQNLNHILGMWRTERKYTKL